MVKRALALAALLLAMTPGGAVAARHAPAPALSPESPSSAAALALRPRTSFRPRTTFRPRTRFAPRRTVGRRPSLRRFGGGILRALGIAYLLHLFFGWGAGGSPWGLFLLLAVVSWLVSRTRRRRYAYAPRW